MKNIELLVTQDLQLLTVLQGIFRRIPQQCYNRNEKLRADNIHLLVAIGHIDKSSASKDATKNFSVLKPVEQDPQADAFAGASHLKIKIGTGADVCMASDVLPIDKQNWYVLAWLI